VETGIRTSRDSQFGFAYLINGSLENYFSRDVSLGGNNDPVSSHCNTAAIQEILDQDNMFFNNSVACVAIAFAVFYRIAVNSVFLANVLEDISLSGWYRALLEKLLAASSESQLAHLGRSALHKSELALARQLPCRPSFFGRVARAIWHRARPT